jgi:peptide/nickel transport system permease protein
LKGYRNYFTHKFFWYLLTFFVALALNFFLPRFIPGNPVDVIVAKLTQGMSDTDSLKAVYAAVSGQFGMDKPLWQQFFIYVGNLLHGDMGVSIMNYPRTVSSIIGEALPWTIALQLPAIAVSWILGNVLGALAAYLKGVFDKAVFQLFLFFSCIPPFAFALLFIWLFGIVWKVAPVSGGYGFDTSPNFSLDFILSVLSHYQLPFWSIVLVGIGGQSLGMREMSIYELNADYVKYSRLLGVRDSKIVGYVFRNAMLPQLSGLALSLGTMVGGALVAEIVFSYPGVGTAMFRGITSGDYTMISGCTLMVSFTVLLANFVVDIIYGLVDPRIKAAQQE